MLKRTSEEELGTVRSGGGHLGPLARLNERSCSIGARAIAITVVMSSIHGHSVATPPCPYSVTEAGASPDCGFWGFAAFYPRSINSFGQWAGYRHACPDNEDEIPIKWTPEGGLQTLPMPPQTSRCWAYDLNDTGTIVGARVGVTNGQSHGTWACVWLPTGEFVEIPPLGGTSPESMSTAVNNAGTVVGWRTIFGGRNAFAWTAGTIVDLHPSDFGFSIAEARDIADSGWIAGQFGYDSTLNGRAFRWKDSNVEILQPLPGALTSNGKAVTNSGVIYGECRFQNGSTATYRAAWWGGDGVPVELPPLSGHLTSRCTTANEMGLVLGQSYISPSSKVDVVWVDGQPFPIVPLLTGIPPGQNYGGSMFSLNQAGQILASYSNLGIGTGGGAWIASPTGSFADLNGDCMVDGGDLQLLLQSWGAVSDTGADLNLDGKVDGADLGMLLGAWTLGGG